MYIVIWVDVYNLFVKNRKNGFVISQVTYVFKKKCRKAATKINKIKLNGKNPLVCC